MTTTLTRIQTTGLKAGDFDMRLPCALYLYGRNGSGKSTAIDAIRLLVGGAVAGLPATNDGVMRLCRGELLRVTAEALTGAGTYQLAREWERIERSHGQSKGTFRVSSTVSVIDPAGRRHEKADAEALVLDVLGSADVLDLAGFISMSDARRRSLIYRLGAKRAGWTEQRVRDALAEIGADVPGPVAPDTGETVPDWLARVAEVTAGKLSDLRRQVAIRREAAAGLDEEIEPIEPHEVGQLRAAADRAQVVARERAAEHARLVRDAEQRCDNARQRLAEREALHAKLTRVVTEIADLRAAGQPTERAEVLAAREELDGIDGDFGALDYLRSNLVAAEQGLTKAQADRDAAFEALEQADKCFAAAAAELAKVETEAAAIRDDRRREINAAEALSVNASRNAATELAAVETQHAQCPTCGQAITPDVVAAFRTRAAVARAALATSHADRLRSWAEADQAHAATIAEPTAARDAARATVEEAATVSRRATIDRDTVGQRLDAAREELRKAERRAGQLRDLLREAERTGDKSTRLAVLESQRAALSGQIEAMPVPDVADLARALEIVRTTAAAATGETSVAADQATATARAAEHRLAVYAESARIKAALAETEEQYRRMIEIAEAVGPRGLIGQVVRDALAPLEQAVNRVVEPTGLGRVAIEMEDARGNEVCRPGLTQPRGSWVDFATLSGGERAAVEVALLVGLADLSEAPWRPLVADELEGLDRERRAAFLLRAVELVESGTVSQAILAGCQDTRPLVPGLDVVDVG